jgi:hypothetical protein
MCNSICALRFVASSFPFVSMSSTRMLELRVMCVCVCTRARERATTRQWVCMLVSASAILWNVYVYMNVYIGIYVGLCMCI